MEETLQGILRFIVFDRFPFALLVFISAWITIHLSTRFLNSLGERVTGRRLFFKQLGAVVRFVVVLVAAVVILGSVIQFSREALFTIGGSIAVAVGFAFKDLLASLMAGLILLFDRPFQVGDRIAFAGQYGEVTEIGLRSVRMATLDDNLVSIPNSQFFTGVVSSANAGALDQMCCFDVYVDGDEDFRTAKRLLHEAAATSRYVFLGKPITVVLREGPIEGTRDRFAIRLTVKAYVFDGRYETAFGTDVTERVKRAFHEHGIRTLSESDDEGPRSDYHGVGL